MDLENKIRQFLDDHGVFYTERSKSFSLSCPNCGREKLDIAKEEGNYICYYCADVTHGPAPEPILAELTGEPVNSIRRFLRGYEFIHKLDADGFLSDKAQLTKQSDEESEERTVPFYFVNITDSRATDGLKYLEKRGIPNFLAEDLGLLYNPTHKQVVFPVYDGPHYVGYQGRAVYGKVKYNDIEKSKYLMFENTVNCNKVILCEGPISAMKFAKTGIGYVATMGKSISEKQIDKLISLGVTTIYLGLDRDAHREIKTFYEKWGQKFTLFLLEVPVDRDDFGDCDFDTCIDIFNNASPLNRMTFLPDIV